jgi:pimeloyl-ACP methyl ester carboxylesterase
LVWLLAGAGSGAFGFLVCVIPGSLLLAGGAATLLLPGDERTPQLAALGGGLGLVLALPAFFSVGLGMAGLLWALSAIGFIAGGWTSRRFAPPHVDVPDPQPGPLLGLKLALDEFNLATIPLGRQSPLVRSPKGIQAEVEEVRAFFEAHSWLEKPEEYHLFPPPLSEPEIRRVDSTLVRSEHMRFASEYTPRPEEPGRERWQGYIENRTAHAWILRHRDGPRPWLICIHGFGIGEALLSLRAFRADHLHRRLGLNLLFPVLPLHGPRKAGMRGGDLFLGSAFLNTIHAEAQAVWELRRMLGWIRAQGAPAVGVFGLSLGGYTASLFAALESELACVIAGIPTTDLTALSQRIDSPETLKRFEENETTWAHIHDVLRVVSPLAMPPKVPYERRYIFGGAVDRIVPANQVWALWQHWNKPRIVWYAGGHISHHWEPEVRHLVNDALQESGLNHGP